jgi:hypothetical protein
MIECAKARESDGDERRGGVERMRMNVCAEPNCKECAVVTSYFPQPPRAFAATAAATSALTTLDSARHKAMESHNTLPAEHHRL